MLTIDLERIGVGSGTRLLDLGCGTGRHAFAAWKAGGSVVALDASLEGLPGVVGMTDAMRETGEIGVVDGGVIAGDARALPFADGSFDVIVASEIFEHVEDDECAMLECARVLRRDGVLALRVPRTFPEAVNWLLSRDYHNTPGGHVRIYRRSTLERRLSAAGLEPTGHHHAHGLHSPYWWLRCLVGPSNDSHPAVEAYH